MPERSPLLIATRDNNIETARALIPAAHHGHPDAVRELLKTAIDVDHVNRLGWTALLETIILSDGGPVHQEILAQLIAAGADVNLADAEGASPLTHARRRGYTEMVEMLEAAGALEALGTHSATGTLATTGVPNSRAAARGVWWQLYPAHSLVA